MRIINGLTTIIFAAIILSACASQGEGNNNHTVPLMKQEKPTSPAAAISGGSGFPHNGMSGQ